MMKWVAFILGISLFIMGSCNDQTSTEPTDTPTSGFVKIAADETLLPIVEAEKTIFEHDYPKAKVAVQYASETGAIRQLIADSVKVAVIGRELYPEEKAFLDEKKIVPRYTHFGTDAVALVIHPNNKDTSLTYDQVIKVLQGEISDWKQLGKFSGSGKLNIVFDNQNSGTVSYVLNQIGKPALPANAYALKTNREAVNYVATHENAIGVVGWCWLSDSDDPVAKELLSKIKVVGISPKDTLQGVQFFKPYAVDLASGLYPFARKATMVNCEGRTGLGTGFVSFVAGEKGQLLLLKAGIYPRWQPTRELYYYDTPKIKVVKD